MAEEPVGALSRYTVGGYNLSGGPGPLRVPRW